MSGFSVSLSSSSLTDCVVAVDAVDAVACCRGYVEIDGRYCLMLKNSHKKSVGIVHGASNTGKWRSVHPSLIIFTSRLCRPHRVCGAARHRRAF